MKKIISLLTCVIHIALFLSGCSVDFDRLLQKIQETNPPQEQETPIYMTIITALENDDIEMFKSVYSDYALEKAVDLEEGFEYICEIYSGDFEEITHSNNGGGTEYIFGSRGSINNRSFGIRTDEKYYILRYSQWDFPEYESMTGIYGVQLVESTKEDTIHVGGRSFHYAGIYYPENEFLDIVYGRIIHFLEKMEDGIGFGNEDYNVNIKESFSDELLSTKDLDDKLADLLDYFDLFSYADIELAWYSDDLKEVYFRIDDFKSYLYLRFDDEQTDKIKIIQAVKIDGDKPIEEYVFESESGIYLPQ